MLNLLAYDLGASSGRAILGRFDGNKLALDEISRFSNDPVDLPAGLYWDALGLFTQMQNGLTKAVREHNRIDALGIDTWGVDFGLLDARGELLCNPRHYRDSLTSDMPDAAFAIREKEWLYEQTGIAFMPFNTLYQLLALKRCASVAYEHAAKMLFMPDLFSYFFCGEMGTEYTIASTSQLLDPEKRAFSPEVLSAFGIPPSLFAPLQQPGKTRGRLSAKMRELTGANDLPIVNVGSHDTASAVAAVPAKGSSFAYISSGTWSLLGCEMDSPVRSRQALEANYTNEGGVFGKIRLLRNLMGMWIIQECKREWDKSGDVRPYHEIAALAEAARPHLAFIDPDDKAFMYPCDMPEQVQSYCKRTGQTVPQTMGEIARVVYESLALKYRWSLARQRDIAGKSFDALNIVGGGSNIQLLNRMTADALQLPVIAGPGEATAIGNLLMQASALGEIGGLGELREVVARSFPPEEILPDAKVKQEWDDTYERFVKVCLL